MQEFDVVLVGPVAPPRGGVSAHVERLADLLERNGINVGIIDHFDNCTHPNLIATLKRNPWRYWLEMRRLTAPVVHYHHSRWSTLIAAALARRSSPSMAWIATIHSHDLERLLSGRIPLVDSITRWAICRFDRVIAVSHAVADMLALPEKQQVDVIPAYLRPPNQDAVLKPDEVPTALVSAYSVAKNSASDLYGLDIAGAVLAAACAEISGLRCEVFLSQAPESRAEQRYLDGVLEALRAGTSEGQVLVRIGANLAPHFRPQAVYLRPTRTDGDAVSIREALDSGVPVLASNVVERPEGVEVLPLEDKRAWVASIVRLFSNPQPGGNPNSRPEHTTTAILDFYEEVLGRTRLAD